MCRRNFCVFEYKDLKSHGDRMTHPMLPLNQKDKDRKGQKCIKKGKTFIYHANNKILAEK